MRRKNKQVEAPASGAARITPVDIQQVEFRLAFRGYNERDVDAFLDRITEDLSAYLEENQRLQTTPGVVRVPDRDASGEAEEVLAQAREEAEAIVRRAEDEAAAIRAAAGAGGGAGDARSAIAPFLNKEREFLQGLGGLVQTHAEEIKAMVMALRARAETVQAGETAGSKVQAVETAGSEVRVDAGSGPEATPTSRSSAEGPSATLEPASSDEIRTRLGFEPETVSVADEPAGDEPAAEEPVIVESGTEPVYTTEGSPANDRRERSLRELFWGEE